MINRLHDPMLECLCDLLRDLTSNPIEMEQAYLDWLGEPPNENVMIRWRLLMSRLDRDDEGYPILPWAYPKTFTERMISRLMNYYIDHRFDNGERRGQFK